MHARGVNRTDRLYALVDELRAVAPRARTARQMAARFEVSVRTIERDLGALQQAGVPIYATPGPGAATPSTGTTRCRL
jgi:predicted DNA-binding transcriptional regulator YafY